MTKGLAVRPVFTSGVRLARTADNDSAAHRFGDEQIAAVYKQAKRYIIDRQVLRLYQKLDLRSGYRSIVICNIWRIDRALDGSSLELFEWSFQHGSWVPSSDIQNWPNFQLLPIERANDNCADPSNELWRRVLRKALWRVLDAAGYDGLPRKTDGARGLAGWKVAEFLFNFYLRPRSAKESTRKGATKLRIQPARFAAAARALRKNVWTDVIDRSVLSVVAIIVGWRSPLTMRDYLRYACHGPALTRLLAQNRNCLPLLSRIQPAHWDRTDLFSRRLWVKDGRKTTLVDRSGFYRPFYSITRRGGPRLSSFASPVAHRWLMRAPVSVVAKFAEVMNNDVIENIALSNLPERVPAILLTTLVTMSRRLSPGVRPEYQRIFRAWTNRCCEIWNAQGYRYLREHLRQLSDELGDIIDWTNCDGLARSLPDKNATWQSMTRQSAAWHEQEHIAHADRNRRWTSLVEDCEIDGFQVRALTTSAALLVEGYQMHHCVDSYDGWCYQGVFRIFSLTDPQGMRSTLCIEQADHGRWVVQQVRSTCNAAVPKTTLAAARQVAKRYTELTNERLENPR